MRNMRQRYGQHFLVNQRVIEEITQAALRLKAAQTVEIGPGKGALTFALIAAGFTGFSAAEIDPEMIDFLNKNLPPQAGVKILEGDFTRLAPGALKNEPTGFVGNLPYVDAAAILDKALAFPQFYSAVFMFQKEQANRVQAAPGTEFYGPLSILSQARAQIKLLCNVGKGSFNPPPKVESAVLTFEKLPAPLVPPALWGRFAKVVRAAFLHRRKTLFNSLALCGYPKEKITAALSALSLPLTVRAEQVGLTQFVQLANAL